MDMNKILVPGENTIADWDKSPASFTGGLKRLDIKGKPVMQSWETPFMHALATNASKNGGRIMETGFGLALAASKVQTFNITEHVIIEYNNDVFARLLEWKETVPNKVTPLQGKWQDVAPKLEDNSFDGIIYDTWAHSKEVLHTHHFEFIRNHGHRLLKPGGILSYSNLMSWEELMQSGFSSMLEMFERTQVPELLKIGFTRENITAEVIDVSPPKECTYYSLKQVIVPKLTKM